MVNVDFRRIKLKNNIRTPVLFKPDRNESISEGAAKWPYPPTSFRLITFLLSNSDFYFMKHVSVNRKDQKHVKYILLRHLSNKPFRILRMNIQATFLKYNRIEGYEPDDMAFFRSVIG